MQMIYRCIPLRWYVLNTSKSKVLGMMDFVTLKIALGRNRRKASTLVTITIALLFSLSARCKTVSIPDNSETSVHSKEPAEVSESVSIVNELSEQIKKLVRGLEYSDIIAEDFNRVAMDWKDGRGRPVLIHWKEKLSNAHQKYQEGKITRNHVANIEEAVLEEFCEKIKKQFNSEFVFELSDVIQNQQANCLGYSQLTYIIGNAIGLSVRPIDVLDPVVFVKGEVNTKGGHAACIIDLFNSQQVMADMTWFYEVSLVFKLEDHYAKVGKYWELEDKDNPLFIHRRIRLLDRKGLLAGIYNNRGSVYKSKGEYDRAILEFNKAIETDPGFTKPYYNRGNAYADKDEIERAILDYTKAIEIDPRYVSAYCNRGFSYSKKGDYERAILEYNKAIEIDPRFAMAYYSRGTVYSNKGEHDWAILDFTKAIEINPKYADAYNNRGVAYYDKDQYDRAILDFEKVIEINPKSIDAYNNRGIAYADKGELDLAILDFTKAIEINPKHADAYNNRGLTYVDNDEYDRAILDFTKAIEINPKYADAYNNRGNSYYGKKEYDRAILDYEKAIEIDPNYAVAYLNRGEVHAELGKSEKTKKDLLKALELDPELKESVKKISEQYELDLKLE